jgi:hypothetical protein
MKSLITLVAPMTAVLGLTTGNADAGHERRQIDNTARTLAGQTAQFSRELRLNFSDARQSRNLQQDANAMAALADHVHDVARDRGQLVRLRQDVANIDRLFHQIDARVADLERDARRPARYRAFPNGNGYEFHAGSTSGRTAHISRLRGMLNGIGATIHDLQEDLDDAVRGNGRPGMQAPFPPAGRPGFPSNNGGPVFRSNDGRFSISFSIR